MTDEQIKAAARRLCELRGQDPDAMVIHGPKPDQFGFAPAVAMQSPMWVLTLDEIQDHLRVREAVAFGEGS